MVECIQQQLVCPWVIIFFGHISLFMVFVMTLWQVSKAGQEAIGRTTNSLVYSQTTCGPFVVFYKASEINGDWMKQLFQHIVGTAEGRYFQVSFLFWHLYNLGSYLLSRKQLRGIWKFSCIMSVSYSRNCNRCLCWDGINMKSTKYFIDSSWRAKRKHDSTSTFQRGHMQMTTLRSCVLVRRFYSKVDFPPVGISSCHQMTSEHLLFANTNTFALSYLDQACSWIVYVTSGCCRKHLKSIESICADILSGFHHYFPKIYCSLRHFFAETLDWCIYRPMIYFNECPQSQDGL